MSRFTPKLDSKDRKENVFVLTGGSNGIGAATVELLCSMGAKVVFGDIQIVAAEKLVQKLSSSTVKFVKTDVTKYGDLLKLFDTALEIFGRIDCAISNAGVPDIGNWIDPELDLEGIKQIPDQRTLDVNLLGTLYFARIAAVYLRQAQESDDDKSLILMSSAAGIKEWPHMPASKHGIIGLMRCLRLALPQAANIRVNAICPFFTATNLTAAVKEQWMKHDLPVNEPTGVAEIIVGAAAQTGMNGKAIYIEGNRAWDIEENIDKLSPQWMGEQQTKDFYSGIGLIQSGGWGQI